MRICPWTDARGSQEQYCSAVQRCCRYHQAFPYSNPDKIPPQVQVMTLHVHLYDPDGNLWKTVTDDILRSEDGANSIIDVLHKRDSISVVNSLFENFSLLLDTKGGDHENFKNFESSFSSQVAA